MHHGIPHPATPYLVFRTLHFMVPLRVTSVRAQPPSGGVVCVPLVSFAAVVGALAHLRTVGLSNHICRFLSPACGQDGVASGSRCVGCWVINMLGVGCSWVGAWWCWYHCVQLWWPECGCGYQIRAGQAGVGESGCVRICSFSKISHRTPFSVPFRMTDSVSSATVPVSSLFHLHCGLLHDCGPASATNRCRSTMCGSFFSFASPH